MSKKIINSLDTIFGDIAQGDKEASIIIYCDEAGSPDDPMHMSICGNHASLVALVCVAMDDLEGFEDVIRDAIKVRGISKAKDKSKLN